MTDAIARRDVDELGALMRFHDRISGRLHTDDPAELLRHVAAGVADGLPADQSVVVILNPETGEIVATGGGEDEILEYDELMAGVTGRVLESGETVLADATTLDEAAPGAVQRFLPGAKWVVATPIRFHEKLVGTLSAANLDQPLEAEDARVLEAMAAQAGVVIGYSLRLEAEQRQRRLADTLRDVTSGMTSTLDLRGVLGSVLDGLDQVLSSDTATLMLRIDDSMRVMASRGFSDPEALRQSAISITHDPIITELIEGTAPVIVSDGEERATGIYVGDEPMKSFIGVPLLARNRVIGALTVASHDTSYRLEEAMIVDAFGDHAAVAIQNARLFQRTQATLAKTETLYRVAQNLIEGSSLEQTLQTVVDGVAEALPANGVSLITMNPRAKKIVHFVRGGEGRDRVVAATFEELWDGLAGYAMREHESLISPEGRQDEREGPQARARREATGAGAVMVAPLSYAGKVFGVLTAINQAGDAEFSRHDLILHEAMANQAAIAIENARLFEEVQRLAVTDDLTGLRNRRGFFEVARRELERATRTGRPLSALMLDIDGFKRVNDTYGHAIGDEVLRHLAERCRRAVRDIDLVGRYGGEEFAVLLPETDLKTALEVAERVRSSIGDTPFDTEVGPLPIRVSVGLALLEDDSEQTVESLLDRADTAMYLVKQEGGDAVRSAEAEFG
ncbi:MAG: sensor domain-containing diguanylate cyclase [Acidimicrobiia bacterium]|nr:sensor domain-containing diguanylate cyclase [Acidimicrobiia bacterium]